MTLVEVSVVAVLTSAVLAIFYGSAVSVGSMTAENNREARSDNQRRDALEMIRSELQHTGKEGRFSIAAGGRSITYTKLIGAARKGAEVSGVWSQSFTIGFDQKSGGISRKDGKITASWATGVRDLVFTHKSGDASIGVKVVTQYNGRDVARTIQVYPRN